MDRQAVIEKWNERYRQGFDDLPVPLPFFVNAVAELTPGQALDLACGLGRHSTYMADRGWQVTAIDASQVAISQLQKNDPRINAIVEDIESPEFQVPTSPYDLIIDTFFLHRPLFPQIKSALKPGALAIFAFHLTGTFGITEEEVNQLKGDYEVIYSLIHTDIPTVELVLRKSSKS